MKKILLSLAILLFTACSHTEKTEKPGKYDTFAQCVTNSGAIFYGTEWCSHCKKQKALFGNSMSKIIHIDCDKKSSVCKENKITGYPTWVFGDKSRASGTQTLSDLAKATNCKLTEDILPPK